VTDGPFAEAQELIVGLSMIRVKSKEEAIGWVLRRAVVKGEGREGGLELRHVFAAKDSGPDCTPESRECE